MKAQRTKDTAPETALRSELHRLGLRFRKQRSVFSNRRKHDVVFGPAKVVVEVRGCFWHGCPDHHRTPKNNSQWWEEKIARNRARDLDTAQQLRRSGWKLVVVWEHEDPAEAARKIERVVSSRR
jgi:DNA mismatch endonuclease (patch repair protein)